MTGEPPPPMPSRVSAWSVYDVFTLATTSSSSSARSATSQFLTLCRVLEAPELPPTRRSRQRSSAVARAPELLQELGEILRHHDVDELCPKLEAAGIPYAPIVRARAARSTTRTCAKAAGCVPMQTEDGGDRPTSVLLPLTMGGAPPRRAPAAAADRRTYRRDPRVPPQPARQALSRENPWPSAASTTARRRRSPPRPASPREATAHRRGSRVGERLTIPWPARWRVPTT